MNREVAIAHFQSFGVQCNVRHRGNGLDVIGIQLRDSLVRDEDLAMLQHLAGEVDVIGLENTAVTDAGLKHLCQLRVLDNIDLANTAITDAGLDIISCIKTLECLCVENTKVTSEGVRRFETAVPECYVTWDGRPV